MSLELADSINEWFERLGDESEFVRGERNDAYAVIGTSNLAAPFIYATKPSCVLAAKRNYPDYDALGLIGRIGLPNSEDASVIRDLAGQHELKFLGDMDPVDLMVFAWLRAHLGLAQVTYLGISDSYLRQLQLVVPQTFIMSCAPSEQTSLSFLRTVLPDFRELIGPDCAALLDDGRKIEMEAVASSLGPPGPLLLPALLQEGR